MSTRATILIESKSNNESLWVYRHCDGYPEGAGEDLKEHLKNHFGVYENSYNVATSLIKHGNYELTSDFHGDSEFVYKIDEDTKTLTCYAYPIEKHHKGFTWNEKDIVFTFDFKRRFC